MRVLVHLGLNKCASTFVQQALKASAADLRLAGVAYSGTGTHAAHYGLSQHYGFGPDAPGLGCQGVTQMLDKAAAQGCDRVILSSEYLSLYRPKAAARLVVDLERAGASAEYLMYSRPPVGWIAALFNQYVKTVDNGRTLENIDAFVDQVLANGAVNIAQRYNMWRDLVGADALHHYRMTGASGAGDVLGPFRQFSEHPIQPASSARANSSLSADQIFSIGELRQQRRTVLRDRAIAKILAGGAAISKAPGDYLRISDDRMARLRAEIFEPYEALPWQSLDLGQIDQSAEHRGPLLINPARSLSKLLPERGWVLAQLERHAGRALNTLHARSQRTNIEHADRAS